MRLSKHPRAALRAFVVSGEPPSCDGPQASSALIEAAAAQRLLGLLDSVVPESWPAGVRERLRSAHRALLLRGVRQLDLTARVQGLFAARGLRVLPLKGAALAERAYDDVGERPMDDVDLLALDDWTASVGVLTAAGFREAARADHAWSFHEPETGEVLELHRGVTSCPGFYPLDADALWDRSHAAEGQVVRVPAAEDLLVFLALHTAFQHGFVLTLVQHLDVRRVLERLRPDPERVLAVARRARASLVLAATLAVAARVVAAPVPPELSRALPLGGRLGQWLDAKLHDPLEFVAPAPAPVARARWLLASGRRLEWLRRTLWLPDIESSSHGRRLVHVVVRTARIVRRWGPTLPRA